MLTRWDFGIAGMLAVASVAILLATPDVGFPRDEGYYFNHAARYQDWFVDVERDLFEEGGADALGRDAVANTWSANAEHPPLAKMLFGLSWRHLAEKRRMVERIWEDKGNLAFRVRDIGRSDGFWEGQSVTLLEPLGIVDSRESEERILAVGTIVREERGRVVAHITSKDARLDALRERCAPETGTGIPRHMTKCEAVVTSDLGGLSESTAMRLPAMVLMALLVATIHLFAAAHGFALGGVFAAAAFLFVPRHFFHAHLAGFDIPITALVFWTVTTFWLSLTNRRWVIPCGVLWGLAILTKHNALLVPLVLALWWLSGTRFRGRDRGTAPPVGTILFLGGIIAALAIGLHLGLDALLGTKAWVAIGLAAFALALAIRGHLVLRPLPGAFVSMALLGPLVFFLGWPRLWYDTLEHLLWYLNFHLKHAHYMQVYFGEVFGYPPFPVSFPFGMTLLTVPIVTLVLAIAGAGILLARGRRDRHAERPQWRFGVLLGLHVLTPMILIALPHTPIFGGVKHWLPSMPFFCLLAGLGFQAMVARLGDPAPPRWASAIGIALLALCLAPAVSATLHAHPHGTAYYNVLTGGAPGAAAQGMQRQFWGHSTRAGLDYLNTHVPNRGQVYFHKSPGGCWKMYQRDGLLRQDIRHIADIFDFEALESRLKGTTHAVYHHQKDHDEYELAIWRAYGTDIPVWRTDLDGIPILSIYENPRGGLP